MEYQTLIYKKDRLTKQIELSVDERGGSKKSAIKNAFNTFDCLALDRNEIILIETKEI